MKSTSSLRISKAGMSLTGVWIPENLKDTRKRMLFYLYAVLFQVFVLLGIIVIQTIHLYFVLGDIEKMVEVSLLLLTHLAQVAKAATIWLRQDKIKHLLDLLDSDAFNRREADKQQILERTANIALLVSKTLAVASVATALMVCLFPILKTTLGLPLGYPYMTSGSMGFISVYAYQTFSIVILSLGDTSEDFLAGCLMVLASAQLELLCYELATIGQDNYKKVQNNNCAHDEDYEQAVACVKYHQSIISFIEELDDIFGLPVFCQFAATCIIVCVTAFKITISQEPTDIITMIFYLVCIMAELLVYCYSGNIIMYKSKIVAEAIYCSGWVNTTVRTQKILLLMMLRAQRALSITAGKIFPLSLTTFAVILKSSYSYFAVLNRASESSS